MAHLTIHAKINKAYQMLGVIKRNFIYLTPDSFMVFSLFSLRKRSECVESTSSNFN